MGQRYSDNELVEAELSRTHDPYAHARIDALQQFLSQVLANDGYTGVQEREGNYLKRFKEVDVRARKHLVARLIKKLNS